jgi:hypothetical protein
VKFVDPRDLPTILPSDIPQTVHATDAIQSRATLLRRLIHFFRTDGWRRVGMHMTTTGPQPGTTTAFPPTREQDTSDMNATLTEYEDGWTEDDDIDLQQQEMEEMYPSDSMEFQSMGEWETDEESDVIRIGPIAVRLPTYLPPPDYQSRFERRRDALLASSGVDGGGGESGRVSHDGSVVSTAEPPIDAPDRTMEGPTDVSDNTLEDDPVEVYRTAPQSRPSSRHELGIESVGRLPRVVATETNSIDIVVSGELAESSTAVADAFTSETAAHTPTRELPGDSTVMLHASTRESTVPSSTTSPHTRESPLESTISHTSTRESPVDSTAPTIKSLPPEPAYLILCSTQRDIHLYNPFASLCPRMNAVHSTRIASIHDISRNLKPLAAESIRYGGVEMDEQEEGEERDAWMDGSVVEVNTTPHPAYPRRTVEGEYNVHHDECSSTIIYHHKGSLFS